MLARVAENIYWLSRYLERAENTVRLIDVHSRMLLDHPEVDEHLGWIPLIIINSLDEQFADEYGRADENSVCQFLLVDQHNPGSLLSTFGAIHSNLRSCRDVLPRNSYEAINSACRFVRQHIADAIINPRERSNFLTSVQTRLLAIAGNINSTMYHDIGHRFMRIGCVLERADMTSRIIDVQSSWLIQTSDITLVDLQHRWLWVLRSLSGVQMYRQHVRRPINGEDTLRFLLHDESLPRSYAFCINHLNNMLAHFDNADVPIAYIAVLNEVLHSQDLSELPQHPLQLHQFIDSLQMAIHDVASAIADTYFLPPQDSQ